MTVGIVAFFLFLFREKYGFRIFDNSGNRSTHKDFTVIGTGRRVYISNVTVSSIGNDSSIGFMQYDACNDRQCFFQIAVRYDSLVQMRAGIKCNQTCFYHGRIALYSQRSKLQLHRKA